MEQINKGIQREGSFYLFTLRIVPIFPFWMINLVMGQTRLRLRGTFSESPGGHAARQHSSM
ncbi:hypothetical protein [Desulfonatronum thiosulfatophilum]|uniref:hypothetical protein n=1 Tax=Desulfonatronum thiosulfatophilum TaxID=617002 RepID=UPI000B1200BC